jgi:uncharacterized membrane protein
MSKTWNCTRISQQRNAGIFWTGWIVMMLFCFLAIFLLIVTFSSVIGLESFDLNARLLQFWNPLTNGFVWIIISLFGISIIFIIFAFGTRKVCSKEIKKEKEK